MRGSRRRHEIGLRAPAPPRPGRSTRGRQRLSLRAVRPRNRRRGILRGSGLSDQRAGLGRPSHVPNLCAAWVRQRSPPRDASIEGHVARWSRGSKRVAKRGINRATKPSARGPPAGARRGKLGWTGGRGRGASVESALVRFELQLLVQEGHELEHEGRASCSGARAPPSEQQCLGLPVVRGRSRARLKGASSGQTPGRHGGGKARRGGNGVGGWTRSDPCAPAPNPTRLPLLPAPPYS